MSCLLCLRNEGIHLPNESTNDFQILLQLFSLPQEFSLNFEGNKCCSLCRVKLQFAQVLNQEISILSQKLKCFEKEVKEIFVSSFKENRTENCEKFSIQARMKLFKELNISKPEEIEITSFKIEIDPISIFQNEEAGFPIDLLSSTEFIAADSQELAEETAEFDNGIIDPLGDSQLIIPDVQPMNEETEENKEIDDDDSSDESVVFLPSSPSVNSAQGRRSKWYKKLTSPNNSNVNTSANYLQNSKKIQKYICRLCPKKLILSNNDKYENHLQTSHSNRLYSFCTICTRIVVEDKNFCENRVRAKLKQHMTTHTIQPFPCDLCDTSYGSQSSLDRHMETHSEKKIVTDEIPVIKTRRKQSMNAQLIRLE